MVLIGRRLSAAELQVVRDDPQVVTALLYGNLEDEDAEMAEPDVDVDKSWHGIHYLLTGTAWGIGEGAGAAILGGEPVGEDGGYGQPRLLGPDAVRTIATALADLDADALRARYDPDALAAASIYPDIWDEGMDAFDGYLGPHFTELRRFYQTAAANGQAVLLAIT